MGLRMQAATCGLTGLCMLALLAAPPLALTASSAPSETIGLLLLRQQEDSAAPLIEHCVASVPALKRPLEAGYQQFRKRFRKATAPLRAGIGTNTELSKFAPPELIRDFAAMNAESLAQARQLEPRTYCSRLRDNLVNATGESMRRNMGSAFAQFTALARQGR
jgi:hypothetical protein